MIKKEIKKQNNCPLSKTNRISNPQNKTSIKNSKKNDQKNTNNKIFKKKAKPRSISSAGKKEPNKEQITKNYSFNNTLELDYLNFSQIDLFKLDQDDIFIPYYNKKYPNDKNHIISNRYEDSNSTLNDYSSLKNNNNNIDNDIIDNIKKKEDHLINTPSTICNYYEISTNKKKSSNKKKENNIVNDKIIDSNIKKNLSEYYDNDSNNKKEMIKDNKNIENCKPDTKNKNILNKQNYLLTKKGQVIPLMNEIPFSNNLMKNIYSNIYKNNKIKYLSDEKKKNNMINNNISDNKEKININKKNKNKNEEIKTIDFNNQLNDRINVKIVNDKSKIRKMSQQKQKPPNIYYNQFKFDAFFVTPRNINKAKNDKNLSSTKSTKINTHSMAKAKSFSSNKNNNNKINNYTNVNGIIYFNNYKTNNNKGPTNYITIKEIMDDKKRINNKKKSNRTTPKNKTSNYIDKKMNTNYFIKVNLKNNTKSSSNLNTLKKQQSSKENPIFNALSSNMINNINNIHCKNDGKNINNKIKSEIKNNISTLHNMYKAINKNEIKSPNKDDINNNNLFKISKTLTEQNIIHIIQETPKNYKIQKFDSIPFTTIVKKIFVGSSKKDNLINFDSSWKKKEKTKTEQIKCIFKQKTQSDFKPYNDIFKKGGNNCMNYEYGNDKHVKQKLLDRMNKATNNWQYVFKGNKNKKISNEGLSNLKSQNKDNFNYFYKNENIISDGSEKEDEDNF